jgi:hypothetical protein
MTSSCFFFSCFCFSFCLVATNLAPALLECRVNMDAASAAHCCPAPTVLASLPPLLLLLLLAIFAAAIWLASSRKFARQLGTALGFDGLQDRCC